MFLHNSRLSEGDFLDDIHACVLLMTLILSKPQLKAICHVLWTTDEIKETCQALLDDEHGQTH